MSNHDALAGSLEHHLIRSERLRMTIIAATVAAMIVVFSIGMMFFRSFVEGLFDQRLPPIEIGLAALLVVLYELGARWLIGSFGRHRRSLPAPWRIGNALIETSIPTLMLIGARSVFGPVDALDLPPLLLYSLFIVLSTLRLDFGLSLFTGIVAGAEYTISAALFLHGARGADPIVLSFTQYAAKGALLALSGLLAGLVARELRRLLVQSVQTLEERNRIVGMFGQHVSPAVVDQLLAHNVDLGGEVRRVCLMFLDIRNFTAYSEHESPVEVVRYLNSLFHFMIDCVNRHKGIVNKFLGDGFMAVFGAPIPDRDNCQHALDAAIEILERLAEFNARDPGKPTRIGIGLHSGEAVTGNVGSETRKEYTIIGDTVNVASRIEQLNKSYGSQLIVSEAVWASLEQAPPSSVPLGAVSVKGHDAPINLFRVA